MLHFGGPKYKKTNRDESLSLYIYIYLYIYTYIYVRIVETFSGTWGGH